MQEFTYGDYSLIELAVARFIRDLDPSIFVTQQYMNILGKLELEIRKLQAAAADQTPGLTPPGPPLEPSTN